MTAGPTRVRVKTRPVRSLEPHTPARPAAPSFDPEAARSAWRQFARNGGARRDYARERRTPWVWLVGIGVAAGVALWILFDREAPEPTEHVPALVTKKVAPGEATAEPAKAARRPRSSQGFTVDVATRSREPLPPVAIAEPSPPTRSRLAAHRDPPEIVAPSRRWIPKDLPPDIAKAYRRIPRASYDRAPVGGIAKTGMHVDRIGMGNAYQRGLCDGPTNVFSVRRDGQAHVCFRIVHRRQDERVTVRWEYGGELVRRAKISVPSTHAYRTRAGLGLRSALVGRWTVRIVDDDDLELAAYAFDVVD